MCRPKKQKRKEKLQSLTTSHTYGEVQSLNWSVQNLVFDEGLMVLSAVASLALIDSVGFAWRDVESGCAIGLKNTSLNSVLCSHACA